MQVSPQSVIRDSVVLAPEQRREAFLDLIGSARERIVLSMFRCTDFRIMDGLSDALTRGVQVQLLLTQRAKGWERKIRDIGLYLESMGARVHRYGVPGVKYHAKYLAADGRAIVASLNLTAKCFESTGDFLVITEDRDVVDSLYTLFDHDMATPGAPLPVGLSPRLFIGPDNARVRFTHLIDTASESLRIVDHRIKDADILARLATRETNGFRVDVYGEGSMAPLRSHGKLMIVDGRLAVIGSISLAPASLETGRELAIAVADPECVRRLEEFVSRARPTSVFGKPLCVSASSCDDEEEEEQD